MTVDLRSYIFPDSLPPQPAGFPGTVAQGFLPLPNDTSLWVEISPGIEINRITDMALKSTRVRPGMQIVERLFGLLEVPYEDQGEVGRRDEARPQHFLEVPLNKSWTVNLDWQGDTVAEEYGYCWGRRRGLSKRVSSPAKSGGFGRFGSNASRRRPAGPIPRSPS